jgi:hypothetical protein
MSDKNLETALALTGLEQDTKSPPTLIYSAGVILESAGRRDVANLLRAAWAALDIDGRTKQGAKLLIASAAFSLIAPAGDEDGADPQIAVGRKE